MTLAWNPGDVPSHLKALDSPLTSAEALGFGVRGIGFGVWGLGLMVSGAGLRV